MEERDQNIEDKFILPYFSDQQKWIIQKRLESVPYSVICNSWKFGNENAARKVGLNLKKKNEQVLYPQNITTCLKRSAMGFVWEKGMQGRTDFYLCKADLEYLKEQIYSAARDGSPWDTSIIITKAHEIKISRYTKAQEFLVEEAVEKIKSVDSNNCCLLSQLPKYINEEGKVINL